MRSLSIFILATIFLGCGDGKNSNEVLDDTVEMRLRLIGLRGTLHRGIVHWV